MDHKNFIAFAEQYGDAVAEDILNRIDDLAWSHSFSDRMVSISNIYTHNAANHTYTGFVEYDGKTYAFEYDSGDWNGSVMRQWGDPETVPAFVPPKPTYWDLVPVNDKLPLLSPLKYSVYLRWRDEPWFMELRRGYMYDRYVQPGSLVENHYAKKAADRYLRFIPREDKPVRPSGVTCEPADPSATLEYELKWQYFTDDNSFLHTFVWNAEFSGWEVGDKKKIWSAADFAGIGWFLP